MAPKTSYSLVKSLSAVIVVTLGTWFQSFVPVVGIRICLSAVMFSVPTALCCLTIRAPVGTKKSVKVVVEAGSSVSA